MWFYRLILLPNGSRAQDTPLFSSGLIVVNNWPFVDDNDAARRRLQLHFPALMSICGSQPSEHWRLLSRQNWYVPLRGSCRVHLRPKPA